MAISLVIGTGQLHAQEVDSAYEEVFMPELFPTSVTLDDDSEYPTEPNLQKIDFLKLPKVTSVKERVERMVQGIETDLPPEYDHYGYEIRRYMAGVANPKIFEDGQDDFLIEQIKNVRKAAVIADYWKMHLEKETEELKPLVEDTGVAFSTKTTYKQNVIATKTFLISLTAWIDANETLLMYVFDNPGVYELYYPELIFVKPNLRVEYYNLARKSAQKLKDIRAYRPFAMMVY